MQYINPVLRGYYPDPSICRVGEDFYLVTSTFEFFPGVPLFHSKDLVNWKQIGHCLTRKSQLFLEECRCSGGIYAPTIRYHKGTFFMISTNVSDNGNFIVHTNDIYGEWSDPSFIKQGGIDPSLFFDDDGICYFCGTDNARIMLFEIDPFTGEQLSETVCISTGSGGIYPEAPHIYRQNDFYYLMMAEGGTEYGHMETIFRSRSIYGPYEPCPHNPILTHKNQMGNPIHATGHADLVMDQNGNWWTVCLGIRPVNGVMLHHLGRETFLAPLKWTQDGWPIMGNNGTLALTMEADLPAIAAQRQEISFYDDFSTEEFPLEWNYVRNPNYACYSRNTEQKCLTLRGNSKLKDFAPVFIGIRQQEFSICVKTELKLIPQSAKCKSGICVYYNKDYFYAFSVAVEESKSFLLLTGIIHGMEFELSRLEISSVDNISLKIESDEKEYYFYYFMNGQWTLAGNATTAALATEGTMYMSFTGSYIGLYTENAIAEFYSFSLEEKI